MIASARAVIKAIGYEQEGFHWQHANVDCYVHGQSADIAQGVDEGDGLFTEEGAGDQGIMFGYACKETPALMPAPIQYAHEILQRLAAVRHGGETRLGPDAKSQVTLAYDNGVPVSTTNVVVSTQHSAEATQAQIRDIVRGVVSDVLPAGWMPGEDSFYCNPTGQFVIGGPDGDAGLTGRKIIVDTYGGAAPHGGGAFSGKDPTKVDRSAAYAARYLAKNIVAADLADRCTIQVSYAIGVAKPLSIFVNTYGTGTVAEAKIAAAVGKVMDLRPKGIRTHLGLNRPIYQRTAAYGHFGRDPEADGGFSWEKTDLVDALKAELS
jgi:S-adenosylmethionine synthetase